MQPSRLCLKNNIVDMDSNEFCGYDIALSDNTVPVDDKCFGYLMSDMNCTTSDLSVFENSENKSGSDFLYYDWPEIGNFEDVDQMFRSSDSIFGLGVNKEDDLSWLSSADDLGLGGSGNVLKSDAKFVSPEFNIAGNDASIRGCSINDSMCTAPIRSEDDSAWTSERNGSYRSFTTEPAIFDNKNGFTPLEQMNEHKRHAQNQLNGESKRYNFRNGSLNCSTELPDELMHPPGLGHNEAFPHVDMQHLSQGPKLHGYPQNPLSTVDSVDSHLSDLASVYLKPSVTESSLFPRDSFHALSQQQYMESDTDYPPFDVSSLEGPRLREKLHSCQGSRSSVNCSINNVDMPIFNPGAVRTQGNCCDPEGVCPATPAEMGSLNAQESLTMSSGWDDLSPEAVSFHQLQLVMEQLDLQTKLCIRDGLYRLARNANKRHNHTNPSIMCGDGREPAGCAASMPEGTKSSFTDVETGTNPIDRSIAHLLFHQCSDSSGSFPTAGCSD